MADETAAGVPFTPSGGKNYVIHDVGANARVQQGENLNWTEIGVSDPTGDGAALVRQFQALLSRIAQHPELDEDTRSDHGKNRGRRAKFGPRRERPGRAEALPA